MEDLRRQGWHISETGFNFLTANDTLKDYKSVNANALDTDIKEFGESILSSELKKNVTGKLMVQIQKIRNVSAPKAKEDSQFAPRMLKLILTDGHTTCQAVEMNTISSISRTGTPPGSKVLINGCPVVSGYLLLKPSNCTLLGGKVPALCEKWELVKNMSNYVRNMSGGTDGAPPWVNFGEKIVGPTSTAESAPFKALQEKIVKENNETADKFICQRQGAIAIASTGAVKKVFGGGGNSKIAHTNGDNPNYQNSNRRNFSGGHKNGQGFRGKREPREKIMDKPQKPADKVSLFDFLETKLNVNEDKSVINSYDNTNFFKQKELPKVNLNQNSYKYNNSSTGQDSSNSSVNKSVPKSAVDSISNNLSKVSLNTQYASRSIKQHLNLNSKPPEKVRKGDIENSSNSWKWKNGDLCMAKYWEDGKYYNAVVIDLTERTCVVQFNGYENVEEVLKTDCIPISDYGESETVSSNSSQNGKNYKGSGFRNNRRQYANNYRNYSRAS